MGKLENGLTYYVMSNHKVENRLELRLVVKAGSVLETEKEQGVAHFIEHMAFNGTARFPKNEIINYIESIGMEFGPDLNGWTSFDATLYKLQVPVDDDEILLKAFQILSDWAGAISFDEEEVKKEIGVIIEEWPLGRTAYIRMLDKHKMKLFQGSLYAERLPIGKKEIIESMNHDLLKGFYDKWYRPDLMTVIAIGDVNVEKIKGLIADNFDILSVKPNAPMRKYENVPGNKEPIISIAYDPEATRADMSLYFRKPYKPIKFLFEYRDKIIQDLATGMFNDRLTEVILQPDAPFVTAWGGRSHFVRTLDSFQLYIQVKENEILKGFQAILDEVERVRRYGFEESEVERYKKKYLRTYEKKYIERDKTESSVYAYQMVGHFLNEYSVPDIEFEYEFVKKYLPDIKLEEINNQVTNWITRTNQVITLSMPEKESLPIPKEKELLDILNKTEARKIKAYTDEILDQPLIESSPSPGKIVSETVYTNINVKEWVFENGAHVVVKRTEFKEDEVLMNGVSYGGLSLLSEKDYTSARMAGKIIPSCGVGSFDVPGLRKKLAGKIVGMNFDINEVVEAFSSWASVKDVETMFQLIYLAFTAPRKDKDAFSSYMKQLQTWLDNKANNPEAVFWDTVTVIKSGNHPVRKPWSRELIKEITLSKAYRVFRDRFKESGDFTFVIVGYFKEKEIKKLAKKYIGSLPGSGKKEKWKDLKINPPEGIVKKKVYKGFEKKSKTHIAFSGKMKWSLQARNEIYMMTEILQIRLMKILREEMSGVYYVSIYPVVDKLPYGKYEIDIDFSSSPGRVDELVDTIVDELKKFQENGPLQEDYNKAMEIQKRNYEENLKKNQFWMSSLIGYTVDNINYNKILEYPKRLERITRKKIQKRAKKCFNLKNMIVVSLYPEDMEGRLETKEKKETKY